MAGAPGLPAPERQALQTAIEGLYAAFAGYPLRDVIEGCTHCLEEIDSARLHTIPLRLLTEDDLGPFLANSAAHTVSGTFDFKHYLPRLCELMAWHEGSHSAVFPPEELGDAVFGHGYATWPQAEQQALQSFCLAWWRALLAMMPRLPAKPGDPVETLLCTVSQFTKDISPYLELWRRMRSPRAMLHLAVFIKYYLMEPGVETLRSSWWIKRKDQWQQIVQYILDPATLQWMLKMQGATSPSSRPWLINQVLNWLTSQITSR